MHKKKRGGLLLFIIMAFRNIFRNFRRSVFSIVAITSAVFFILVMMSFGEGMIVSVKAIIQTFETGHIMIYSKEYDNKQDFFPLQYPIEFHDEKLNDIINKLQNIEGVKKALPRITSYATLTENTVMNAMLWGIKIEDELNCNIFNLKTNNKNKCLVEGRYPSSDKNECAIGTELAKKLKVQIGDKLPLKIISSQYSDKFYSPTISGIYDFDYSVIDKNYIIIPFEKMQKLAVLSDTTQTLFIYLNNDIDSSKIKKIIRNQILNDSNVIIKEWKEHPFIVALPQIYIMFYLVFALFIIVASFLIINIIIMIINERMKEIGIMGSLGMNKVQIVTVFFIEALLLSLIGSIIGGILGGICTYLGSIFPIDTEFLTGGSSDMSISNTIFFKFSISTIIGSMIYGLLISSICIIFPASKAAFIEPVEALRK